MINLQERLDELRKRYRDTGDIRWLHRFNECKLIMEQLLVDKIRREQDSGSTQRRSHNPRPLDEFGPDRNGRSEHPST